MLPAATTSTLPVMAFIPIMANMSMPRILYIEPFDGGSHAAFTRNLTGSVDAEWTILTMPGRHWKWRMRGSAVQFALQHEEQLRRPHDLLFASSFLPLAEFVGLVPELAQTPRILYFHENQAAYPSREEFSGERDLHFIFTQLTSCLAADRCLFNSEHNLSSMLTEGGRLLRRMPDGIPDTWIDAIAQRSEIIPVLVDLDDGADGIKDLPPGNQRDDGPVILWNHRWEHDKQPEVFFAALSCLIDRGVTFRVCVCGQAYREIPGVFDDAKAMLGSRVVHWGEARSRAEYLDLLARSQIAVSTAGHEFFGMAMIEATHAGVRPLVPDRLSYPEIFPRDFRYTTDMDLADQLESLCRRWNSGDIDLRENRRQLTSSYSIAALSTRYSELFDELIHQAGAVARPSVSS